MIRKNIKSVLLIFLFFLVIQPLAADSNGEHEHNITVAEVLAEIRAEQNVIENNKINPDKVSHKLLEKLGDAVMSERFTDPKEHEYMDEMMGGEGSESLRIMHERMGYFYIENGFRSNGRFWGPGMMGMGMINGQNYSYMFNKRNRDSFIGPFAGHMGYIGRGFYGIGWIINLIILGFLATGTVFIFRKLSRTREKESVSEILKKRYARGEISKKEYETLKKEIL